MRLEIVLINGSETEAVEMSEHHKEICNKLQDVGFSMYDAVFLDRLLHTPVTAKASDDIALKRLTQILDECQGLQKIVAIKHLREQMNVGLGTAKYFLDQVDNYNIAQLKAKDVSIRMHKEYIQKILAIFGVVDDDDDDRVLNQLRRIKEKVDGTV